MAREESEGFFEMLWDCPHCDTKGLLGKSQRHCPECGAPQDASTRYFPTPEQQKLVVGHTYEGSDRACPSCGAPQGARAKNCTQCGSPLDGAAEVAGVADIPRLARERAAAAGAPAPAPAPKKRRGWIWLGVLAALAGIGFGVWFLFVRSHSEQVTIASHRWARRIAIEEYGDHHREAWRDQVPVTASFPICSPKQRSTHQVADGETCHSERKDKKDGTFEQVRKCQPKYRDEPVMGDWCSFTVKDWERVSEAVANGTGLAPTWPTPDLGAMTQRRAGARTETYTLDFVGGDACDVDEPVWRKYADGQKVLAEVRARSSNVVCGSL